MAASAAARAGQRLGAEVVAQTPRDPALQVGVEMRLKGRLVGTERVAVLHRARKYQAHGLVLRCKASAKNTKIHTSGQYFLLKVSRLNTGNRDYDDMMARS